MPVSKYEPDYRSIKKIKSNNGVDAAVNHAVPIGIDGVTLQGFVVVGEIPDY